MVLCGTKNGSSGIAWITFWSTFILEVYVYLNSERQNNNKKSRKTHLKKL